MSDDPLAALSEIAADALDDVCPATMTDARRDVSWSVVFRVQHSNDWTEWSRWPTPGEAVTKAEALAKLTAVAEIRFERVIVQRDRFSLHDLTVLDDTKEQR